MRFARSMVSFVDGGLPFGSLDFHHQFLNLLGEIVERFVGGIYSAFSDLFIGERFGWCRQGWLDVLNAAGRNDEATDFIHCFPEGLLGLFDSSCFASFSKVFVADFSIACPVRFLEVDVGSPRPINRGQFGVDGDEDRQMIAGHWSGDWPVWW